MKHLILAITFLTRIYIPNKQTYGDSDFAKSVNFYPFVGVIIGGLLVGLSIVLNYFAINPDISAFLVLFFYITLSGGLHLDGLADVCDGLFSGRPREKILDIMKDSRVGTFGVIGLILYFLGMWITLKEADWQMLFLFPVIGRSGIVVTAGISKYAKEKGLGKSIVEATNLRHVAYAILFTVLVSMILKLNLVIPVLITFFVVVFLTKRISVVLNGITGDVMGMMVEVSQCIFLMMAVFLTSLGV